MRTHALRLVITSILVVALTACSDEATTNSVSSVIASDQTPAPVNVVVVDQIDAAVAGWIVIHADANGGYGTVLGQTAVPSGVSTDVEVTLSTTRADGETLPRPSADGETLHAMLHVDHGQEGNYEFPGADEPVLSDNGLPVTASFVVSVPDQVLPALLVDNQTLDPANVVTVKKVVAVEASRVAIHADDAGDPGEVLGFTDVDGPGPEDTDPLAAATSTDVSVTLSRNAANDERLFATLQTVDGEPIIDPLTGQEIRVLFTVSVCVPECTDKVCGDDGCGGVCGTCSEPTNCATFACEPTTGLCEKTYISCSEEYAPVCGEDGLSYANTCQAECNGQTTVGSEGSCDTGTLTCSELITTCSATCFDENFADWACLSACGEQGTEAAQELIVGATICALAAGCLDAEPEDNQAFIDCATAACPDEVTACQADVP